MATLISHSPAATEALGESWGQCATPGLVIGLSGDLGAGKTQLVKGLARGLGIASRVHSPTFALVNEYGGGRLLLLHLDLYRLETPEQVRAAGLEDFLARGDGVTVVEWVERCRCAREISARYREVRIEVLSDVERRIVYEDSGA